MKLTFAQTHSPTGIYFLLGCWFLGCWTSPILLGSVATIAAILGHLTIGAAAYLLLAWEKYVSGCPKVAPKPNPLHPDLPMVAEPSLQQELHFAFTRAMCYRVWALEALCKGVYEMFNTPTVEFASDEDQLAALMNSVAFQYMKHTPMHEHDLHKPTIINAPPARRLPRTWSAMSDIVRVSEEDDEDRATSDGSARGAGNRIVPPHSIEVTPRTVEEILLDSSDSDVSATSSVRRRSSSMSPATGGLPPRRKNRRRMRSTDDIENNDMVSELPVMKRVASARPSPRAMSALIRQRSAMNLKATSPVASAVPNGLRQTQSVYVAGDRTTPSPQRALREETAKPAAIAKKEVELPPLPLLNPGEQVWTMDLSMFDDLSCYGGVYMRGVVARFALPNGDKDKARFLDITIVGNGTFYPPKPDRKASDTSAHGDPGSWKLAKLFAMQAVAYNALWVNHVATHLPLDAFTAVSLSVLPEYHVVFQLVQPHTLHTLALEDSLFFASGSPVNHDDTGFYKTWAHGRDEHIKKLVFGCKQHRFNERLNEIREKKGMRGADFLLAHYEVIHAFVVRVLDHANVDPTTDVHLLEWERQLADTVVGLPEIADARDPRAVLAEVVATFIFEVSVRHSYDHQSLYHHVPIRWAPLRIHVPPPVQGRCVSPEMLKPTNVVHRLDLLKHRIFADVFMQWSRNPVVDQSLSKVQYAFTTPDLQAEAQTFRDNLKKMDQQLSQKLGKWHLASHLVAPSIQW